jgi:hypothetical protein
MAYSYLIFAVIFWIIGRFHRRHHDTDATAPPAP